MNVVGYVVRFCTNRGCSHTNEETCPNLPGSKYYISPDHVINITGKPLVVTHNQKYIVGICKFQSTTNKGILVVCNIDDAYFMECLGRRYNDFKEKYNPNIEKFETLCKKTLSSFSLSHDRVTNDVRHVSLVDTPGRLGTAVTYIVNNGVVLKYRKDNLYISDALASHSTAYLTAADRRNYLLKNTSFSYNPEDLGYINASRTMNHHADFDQAAEIYKIMKAIKRTRQNENDSPEIDDGENNSKRSRANESVVPPNIQQVMVDAMRDGWQQSIQAAMRDGVQQGINAAVEMINQQTHPHQPETTTPTPPVANTTQMIEAAKPPPVATSAGPVSLENPVVRTPTVGASPEARALEIILNHITAK